MGRQHASRGHFMPVGPCAIRHPLFHQQPREEAVPLPTWAVAIRPFLRCCCIVLTWVNVIRSTLLPASLPVSESPSPSARTPNPFPLLAVESCNSKAENKQKAVCFKRLVCAVPCPGYIVSSLERSATRATRTLCLVYPHICFGPLDITKLLFTVSLLRWRGVRE